MSFRPPLSLFGSDTPFWLDRPTDPPEPPFEGEGKADVVIVGGGFSGLWTAIQLKDSAPAADVLLLEQAVVGYGASGRNGGIIEASLTHGLANGLRHFPDEIDILQAEGSRNSHELVAFIRREGIDCNLEEAGSLTLATAPWQADGLDAWARVSADHGEPAEVLSSSEARAEIHSPTVVGGLRRPPGHDAIVDPGKLVRGLKRVALARGVRIHEGTRVVDLDELDPGVRVRVAASGSGWATGSGSVAGSGSGARGPGSASGARGARESGSIRAKRVVVATSAYSGWFRRLQTWFVPVYDYVLVSEPLTIEQKAAIGWDGRQGAGDAANRFHYFRLTADDRILWGGYDAVYQGFSRVAPKFDARPASFERLDRQFREFLPQLESLRWTHRWGGAIDVTSNFTVTFGKTMSGRVVYVLGYTGLGVAASRWAAGVVRDMLVHPDADVLRMRFVRDKPWPIPPEPLRSVGVALLQREYARADDNEGRKSLFLRTLESMGIGFDS
jgi:glycine/D-amino acid oxidase-like deaminating enzyme